jgi:hypothetical protein
MKSADDTTKKKLKELGRRMSEFKTNKKAMKKLMKELDELLGVEKSPDPEVEAEWERQK